MDHGAISDILDRLQRAGWIHNVATDLDEFSVSWTAHGLARREEIREAVKELGNPPADSLMALIALCVTGDDAGPAGRF